MGRHQVALAQLVIVWHIGNIDDQACEGMVVKRIVVLIDGTWNKEGDGADTNVAKLDSGKKIATQIFIKPTALDGTVQNVHYHDGVGSDGDLAQRALGGAIGLGLKKIIQEAYAFVVADYVENDEIYIIGFSRGAYAARALAGLIGASGIQRRQNAEVFEVAWRHYRVAPSVRGQPEAGAAKDQKTINDYAGLAHEQLFHDTRTIKCVAVWDTVGSYGIPAGIGLAPLARYYTLVTLGFHDTSFGDHVEIGLHALAVDEHRRPFVPTFWTIPKGQSPKGHVEQTWFAGAHCNVGGGYADCGLSDQALFWMIARMQALSRLEFDIQAVKSNTKPNISGAVVDSTQGWLVDHALPHYRTVLSPVAIQHGYLFNSENPAEEHINERVHWSVIEKRAAGSGATYAPSNLPIRITAAQIADITSEERTLLGPEAGA
jgi:uncharacterized protein (DUF2235 family)